MAKVRFGFEHVKCLPHLCTGRFAGTTEVQRQAAKDAKYRKRFANLCDLCVSALNFAAPNNRLVVPLTPSARSGILRHS